MITTIKQRYSLREASLIVHSKEVRGVAHYLEGSFDKFGGLKPFPSMQFFAYDLSSRSHASCNAGHLKSASACGS